MFITTACTKLIGGKLSEPYSNATLICNNCILLVRYTGVCTYDTLILSMLTNSFIRFKHCNALRMLISTMRVCKLL